MECPGVAIILCSLFWWLPSLENMHWRLLCMLSRLHSSFLFSSAKHSIARTGHVYLSTHLLKGSLFISKIQHFWRKLSKHPCVASFAHFKIAFFFFFKLLLFWYIWNTNHSSAMWIANVSSHALRCLSAFSLAALEQPVFHLEVQFIYFCCCLCLWCHSRETIV